MKQNWRKRKEMGGDKGKLKGEKAVLRLLSSRIHGSLYSFRRSNRPIISRASLSLVLDRTPAQASSPTSRRKRRTRLVIRTHAEKDYEHFSQLAAKVKLSTAVFLAPQHYPTNITMPQGHIYVSHSCSFPSVDRPMPAGSSLLPVNPAPLVHHITPCCPQFCPSHTPPR